MLTFEEPRFEEGTPWNSVDLGSSEKRSPGAIRRGQSAPMLPAGTSTQASTWYPSHDSLASGPTQSWWKPLGSTFRDWEAEGTGQVRRAVDDSSRFAHGCVPHWGKDASMRTKGLLEHELAWAYYRMRRHVEHPLRKEMGETLPQTDLIGSMRFGKKSGFNFWRDLRPPFCVKRVVRTGPIHDVDGDVAHLLAAGDLHRVTYECGIEYASERMMGLKGDGGTFDNRIHGDALVRFSNNYPQKRPLTIVSWGRPTLNQSSDDAASEKPLVVDPRMWMPISQELGARADDPSMKTCRALTDAATRKKAARDRRGVEVPELDRLLLGPHASLPRLATATQNLIKQGGQSQVEAGEASQSRLKMRSHTIRTSAAGFVRYAG